MCERIRFTSEAAGTLFSGRRGLILVGLLAVLPYLNTLPGTFLPDDLAIVLHNPLVASLDLRTIFTVDYWGKGAANSGLFRPLTISSFALNTLLFGPGPLSFHLINILLHAGVSILLAMVLRGIGFSLAAAVTAAALFAVHPVHGSVVNEIVGRSELLVALFLLLGLWLSLSERRWATPLVVVCFAAALLAKEHAVVFLPLLVLTDAYAAGSFAPFWRRRRVLIVLLLCVTILWLFLRHAILSGAVSFEAVTYQTDNPLVSAGLIARALTAGMVNMLYAAALLVPLRLQAVYSGSGLMVVERLASWGGIGVLAYLVCSLAVVIMGWKRRRGYAFGIAWFFIAFGVTGNLFFVTAVLRADRFAYLPSAGFCFALASLLMAPGSASGLQILRRTGPSLAFGAVALFAGLTVARNPLFKEPVKLWKAAIKIDPGNARAWYFLAGALREQGDGAEAERAYRSAISADPSFPDPFVDISLLLMSQGRTEEAVSFAKQGMAKCAGGVGAAQLVLALASSGEGRSSEALAYLDSLGSLYDRRAEYWEIRGSVLENLGLFDDAVHSYRRALMLGSAGEVSFRLAEILFRQERYPEAEAAMQNSLGVSGSASGFALLGRIYTAQGKIEEARRAFATARQMEQGRDSGISP